MGIESIKPELLQAETRRWNLNAAGCFALFDSEGRDVTPRGRKACAIIAYLSAHPAMRVSRDRLMDLLWGDRGQTQARDSLRQSLAEIRRCAGDLVRTDRDRLWIESDQIAVEEPGAERDAPLFDDLNHVTPEFDEWLAAERQRRELELWERLRCQVEALLACGRGAEAISLLDRMHPLDPYSEDWLRLAMKAEFHASHPAGIQRRFKEMAESLRQDLGVAPAAETRALHDRLLVELSSTAVVDGSVSPASLSALSTTSPQRQPTLRRLWTGIAASLALVSALGLTQSAQTAAAADPPRVAVLPFQAMGGVDPMLAEGIASELLSNLSHHRGLQTIGRTSSWIFKDRPEDLRRVGRKLDVDYVVEGSVRRFDGALSTTVSLINTRDASTIWSGRFNSQSGNVLAIENAAASAILKRLGLHLATSGRTADPRVYAMYVRAKALMRERKWPQMSEAHDLLITAVRLDPTFAPAWAQLSGAITFLGTWGKGDPDWPTMARAAAARAIALDPKLAEGHQMLAFSHGFSSEEARVHLHHALQLNPRNPQSLYWWALIAERTGKLDLGLRAASASLANDPLWVRPAELVGQHAIRTGKRSDAYALVERLRAADVGGAVEVEISLAKEEGDLSRVVQIGLDRNNKLAVNSSAANATLGSALRELGYVREALLVEYAGPFERALFMRRLPNQSTILDQTRTVAGKDEEFWLLHPVLLELLRTDRVADVVALYDRDGSGLKDLQRIRPGNRMERHLVGTIVGRALAQSGRSSEAARLFRGADEAQHVILQNKDLGGQILAEMAMNEAIRGRTERAMALLERAVAKGWFAFDGMSYRLNDLPWFADLGGRPQFERLRRIADERLARERRETQALGLI